MIRINKKKERERKICVNNKTTKICKTIAQSRKTKKQYEFFLVEASKFWALKDQGVVFGVDLIFHAIIPRSLPKCYRKSNDLTMKIKKSKRKKIRK